MQRILATLLCGALSGFSANPIYARSAHVKVQRIHTSVVKLDGVDMRVRWDPNLPQGQLDMRVDRLRAPSVAADYKAVHWRCTLSREAWRTWRCAGPISMPGHAAANFSVDFQPVGLDLELKQGESAIRLQRRSKTPELTEVELASLPVAWARAFIRQSWEDGQIDTGALNGKLSIRSPASGGLTVQGPLALTHAKLHTRDGGLIAENVSIDGRLNFERRNNTSLVSLSGTALGDMLVGTTFLSIQNTPGRFNISARSNPAGWHIPQFAWADGATLSATGHLDWTAKGAENLDVQFQSADARALRDRYLSGWLAPLGFTDVELTGGLNGRVWNHGAEAISYAIKLNDLNIRQPGERLDVAGLQGQIAISQSDPVESRLRWQHASLYGLQFGAGDLPFISRNGELSLRAPAAIPVFDGRLRFDTLLIRPPQATRSFGLQFSLGVENVDFGAFSQAIGLPAFRGRLNGTIPNAVYENDILTLDGGLNLDVFEGSVAFSALSIERPFGTAPTLVTDLDLDKLDLLRLTEVLGFGSISGKLSGQIHDLRLIAWSPVRFDSALYTVKVPGVKQRISQRAVQNISSVGGTAATSGLQAKALALFKDFGYSRIGIQCRLVNSVCLMSGLEGDARSGSGSNSFTILQGAGIPRLTVVGHNRRVDWPVLVERLKAVAEGDVKPVFEH